MKEDVRASIVMALGFLVGAVVVSYVVLTDPDVRSIYRRKGNRIREEGWHGLAHELAQNVVLELRATFPKIVDVGEEGTR